MTETGVTSRGASNTSSAPEVLLTTFTPGLFDRNAFRLLGLSNDATMREIERQVEKAQMQAEFGGDHDGPPHSGGLLQPASNVETLSEARRRLLDPEQRIVDELCWFWPLREGEGKSDPGLELLKRGNLQGALDLWSASSRSGPYAPVARHNLALGWMFTALENHSANGSRALSGNGSNLPKGDEALAWQGAIDNWRLLLEEEDVWSRLADRIRKINDPRLTTGFARRLRDGFPKALVRLHARLALSSRGNGTDAQIDVQAQLVKRYNFPVTTVTEELESFFESVATEIDRACEIKTKEAEAEPGSGIVIAKRVLEEMKPSLAVINAFLPPDNYLRVQAHDRIASCSYGCALAELRKNENWAAGIELLPNLVEVAASESQKKRLEDQRGVLQDNLEQQLLYETCWFCQKQPGDKACHREVAMYGNVERLGKTVRFQTRKIAVPRCAQCSRVHMRMQTISWATFIASLVLGFVGLSMVWETEKALLAVFSGALAIACATCAIVNLIDRALKPLTCKRVSDTESHPLVRQAIKEGWALGSKPPNTQ